MAEDIEQIVAIEKALPACPGWTRGQFAEEVERGGVFVAVAEGTVAAFVCLHRSLDEAQILDVGVRPDAQRKGLGRAALGAALDAARADGLAKATLEVGSRNTAAIALYGALGFRVVGRRPKFYNDDDALLMDLDLA